MGKHPISMLYFHPRRESAVTGVRVTNTCTSAIALVACMGIFSTERPKNYDIVLM
jgi:hypothetical protein